MSEGRSGGPTGGGALGKALGARIASALGARIEAVHAVVGGDIAESFRVALDDGRNVFLKHYARLPTRPANAPPIAVAEARGLAWLAEAEAIRIPRPLAHGDDWLALEWIESAPAAPDHDERLGRGMAELHATRPYCFGFESANWIGRLPQANASHDDWAGFYAEERIRPLQRRAHDGGDLPAVLSAQIDRLCETLPDLVGPPEPPARLHGDLWSGNALADEHGHPCLIDPAVYGGHREVDLAMMHLFGGFGPRVFDAYHEAHALAEGFTARIPLYQVYPLLVHVCLFGGSYVAALGRAVEDAMRRV